MVTTLPSPHRSSSPTPASSNANPMMVSVARNRGEDSSSLSKETTVDKHPEKSSHSHSRKRQRTPEEDPLDRANLLGYSDGVLNAVKQFQDILSRQEQWYKRWNKRGSLIRNHVAASHRDMYDDWLADADLFRDQMESHMETLMALLRRTERTD